MDKRIKLTGDGARWTECRTIYVANFDRVTAIPRKEVKLVGLMVMRKDGEDMILFQGAVPLHLCFATERNAARHLEREYRKFIDQKEKEMVKFLRQYKEIRRQADRGRERRLQA